MRIFITLAWRLFLIVLSATVLCFLLVRLFAYPFIYTEETLPPMPTAIVLGASTMSNGTLSVVFRDRVTTAIALYKSGKVSTILITGDNGNKYYNEVTPAGEYMVANGVPREVIFLDYAGFDTYSSMYRARDIFNVKEAIIVTQSFHLSRAVFIARRLGIDAYGLGSDHHQYRFKNDVREVVANVKAVLDVVLHRKPKYLGEEVPITE